jgi:hypothetical protein
VEEREPSEKDIKLSRNPTEWMEEADTGNMEMEFHLSDGPVSLERDPRTLHVRLG